MFNALIDQIRSTYRLAKRATAKSMPLIDETLWRQATEPYRALQRLTKEENRRLRLIASDFLSRKTISGAAGLDVTALIQVQIAAQASLLVLELGISQFDDWSEVIVYPGKFSAQRETTDHLGLVHTSRNVLAGEAWLGGPVVLSYEDVAPPDESHRQHYAHNVVIHEFAHKLDMRNGNANGYPPLHKGMSAATWKRDFMSAYLDFCKRIDAQRQSAHAPVPFDPVAAMTLPIDPYGSQNPAEFFAVASETFFECPELLAEGYPAVYAQLKAFYKQNPLMS